MSAGKTSVVSAAKTSVVSADKRSAVCQVIPWALQAQGRPLRGRPFVGNEEGMSSQTADLLSADTTDVLSADTTDVLAADTTDTSLQSAKAGGSGVIQDPGPKIGPRPFGPNLFSEPRTQLLFAN